MVQPVFSSSELQPIGLRRQDVPGSSGNSLGCRGRLAWLPQPEFERHGSELNGFDVTVWPRWQMVPLGGWRSVIVSFPDGQFDVRQLALHCNADVAAIACRRKQHRIIVDIYGEAPFLTDLYVEHLPSRTVLGRMELSIKERRTFKALFIELQVEGRPHSDRFKFGQSPNIAGLLKGVNDEILPPQVNIEFEPVLPTPVTLNVDKNVVITEEVRRRTDRRTISDDELREIRRLAKRLIVQHDADVGVIFVHELRDQNFSGKYASGSRNGDGVFLADDLVDDTETLAHELSHWLLRGLGAFVYPSASDHSDAIRDLMYRNNNGGRRGRRLRRREADVMNETGVARR